MLTECYLPECWSCKQLALSWVAHLNKFLRIQWVKSEVLQKLICVFTKHSVCFFVTEEWQIKSLWIFPPSTQMQEWFCLSLLHITCFCVCVFKQLLISAQIGDKAYSLSINCYIQWPCMCNWPCALAGRPAAAQQSALGVSPACPSVAEPQYPSIGHPHLDSPPHRRETNLCYPVGQRTAVNYITLQVIDNALWLMSAVLVWLLPFCPALWPA